MADKTQQDMGNELDKTLLDVIKNGQTVVDDSGKAVKVTPSAALLNVIRQRLKDCGVSAAATPESSVGQMMGEFRRQGLKLSGGGKMPAMSERDDAATA